MLDKKQLAWMFATRADNLVNELTSSYYSEANLNAMTNALQSSLVNTLERGYNISGITSALNSIANGANSVADAANNAANALSRMGAAQSSSTSNSNRYIVEDSVGNGQYRVIDTTTGKPVSGYYRNEDQAIKYLNKISKVSGYAKGGIVTKEDDDVLDPIAKAVGEDTMVAVKHGEGILTEKQTNAFVKMAEKFGGSIDENGSIKFPPITWDKLRDIELSKSEPIRDNMPKPVPNVNNNVTVHYDSLININGDVNDMNHLIGQMKVVAKDIADDAVKDSWKRLDECRKYNRY